jgi:hypothetical protein
MGCRVNLDSLQTETCSERKTILPNSLGKDATRTGSLKIEALLRMLDLGVRWSRMGMETKGSRPTIRWLGGGMRTVDFIVIDVLLGMILHRHAGNSLDTSSPYRHL